MDREEHKFTEASRYIESLRHPAKKKYAKEYYQYLRCPEHMRDKNGPEFPGLTYMAAQAVRMNLDQIMDDNEYDEAELYAEDVKKDMAEFSAEMAVKSWSKEFQQVWLKMGAQCCAGCGMPMVPCASGGDEPGYRGFCPCPCGKGDTFPRPSRPELAVGLIHNGMPEFFDKLCRKLEV